MAHPNRILWLAPATLLLVACGDDDGGTAHDSSDPTDRVSYYETVRPILAANCVTCHSGGQIAPFALDSYEAAVELGPLIAASVEARTMPPNPMNADGTCNSFVDPRWLQADEIDAIARWIEADYAEGDPTTPAPAPSVPPTLAGNDIREVGIPRYQPVAQAEIGSQTDDYQCFLVELDLDSDRYLTGFDVLPDNAAIVHHTLGMRVDPSFLGNAETMAELDAASPDQIGWDCFGAAGEGVFPQGVPIAWAPGAGAVNFPAGTGIKFSPGDVMVVQMHYNLSDGNGVDATRINLNWADAVEKEAFNVLWDPFLFGAVTGAPEPLPPGQAAASYAWDDTFREMLSFDGLTDFTRLELLGVLPHMHKRGRTMSIEVETPGQMQCAGNVDRWDFNWQSLYFFEQPMAVGMDDVMHTVCEWDTRDTTEPVMPGFGTANEMCLVGLYFTAE